MPVWGKRFLMSSLKTRSIRARFPQTLENAVAFPTLPTPPTTNLIKKKVSNGNPILLTPSGSKAQRVTEAEKIRIQQGIAPKASHSKSCPIMPLRTALSSGKRGALFHLILAIFWS